MEVVRIAAERSGVAEVGRCIWRELTPRVMAITALGLGAFMAVAEAYNDRHRPVGIVHLYWGAAALCGMLHFLLNSSRAQEVPSEPAEVEKMPSEPVRVQELPSEPAEVEEVPLLACLEALHEQLARTPDAGYEMALGLERLNLPWCTHPRLCFGLCLAVARSGPKAAVALMRNLERFGLKQHLTPGNQTRLAAVVASMGPMERMVVRFHLDELDLRRASWRDRFALACLLATEDGKGPAYTIEVAGELSRLGFVHDMGKWSAEQWRGLGYNLLAKHQWFALGTVENIEWCVRPDLPLSVKALIFRSVERSGPVAAERLLDRFHCLGIGEQIAELQSAKERRQAVLEFAQTTGPWFTACLTRHLKDDALIWDDIREVEDPVAWLSHCALLAAADPDEIDDGDADGEDCGPVRVDLPDLAAHNELAGEDEELPWATYPRLCLQLEIEKARSGPEMAEYVLHRLQKHGVLVRISAEEREVLAHTIASYSKDHAEVVQQWLAEQY